MPRFSADKTRLMPGQVPDRVEIHFGNASPQARYDALLERWQESRPRDAETLHRFREECRELAEQDLSARQKALLLMLQSEAEMDLALLQSGSGSRFPWRAISEAKTLEQKFSIYEAELGRQGIHFSVPALQKLLEADIRTLEREVEEAARQISPDFTISDASLYLKSQAGNAEQTIQAYKDKVAEAENFIQAHDLMSLPEHPVSVLKGAPSEGALATYRFHNIKICPFRNDQLREDWSEHNPGTIGLITTHEAYPGHHVQLGINVKEPIYKVLSPHERCIRWPTDIFYLEGWAVYSEQLMLEQGFLKSPEERFGILSQFLGLARATRNEIRLLTGQISPEGLLEELRQLYPWRSESRLQGLVRAQQFAWLKYPSYYLGYKQMMQLRKQALAEGMSLREFHEQIIIGAVMPVPVAARWHFGLDPEPLKPLDDASNPFKTLTDPQPTGQEPD